MMCQETMHVCRLKTGTTKEGVAYSVSWGRTFPAALLQIAVSLRKAGVGDKWTKSTNVETISAVPVAEQKEE